VKTTKDKALDALSDAVPFKNVPRESPEGVVDEVTIVARRCGTHYHGYVVTTRDRVRFEGSKMLQGLGDTVTNEYDVLLRTRPTRTQVVTAVLSGALAAVCGPSREIARLDVTPYDMDVLPGL